MSLNLDDVKKAFLDCEFPFYKSLEVEENKAVCTLYSIKSDFYSTIMMELSSYEKLIHQISIELIKFRSNEMLINQTAQTQAESIAIHLD
ncbi:hypothetical protein M670_00807 [Schinkia azotoformans MEV2011]|uniref:Uncharacterized protein n=2 Tax=Schinkia azotoformans TaxID=1454 RepID=K6E0X9_SCHAZ|nr:hypothetical protein [Schinkia azotoformans]EKN66826.1 hypothetical protein BAZO_10832 [Schinkia azotoformans LMG 9581]KEF39785.1 hypothetical protein M670_00807 [Schinkia azotoformans MEV2011]MEC1639539.1 hypothetical protein [Schinkia azotoformans]MEC1694995.1 hypothetical protein [Schinkia azotoformans]MEC1722293.1 hypothetical protein [Schinkia azotoformans]